MPTRTPSLHSWWRLQADETQGRMMSHVGKPPPCQCWRCRIFGYPDIGHKATHEDRIKALQEHLADNVREAGYHVI